jgi:hypothetical protein
MPVLFHFKNHILFTLTAYKLPILQYLETQFPPRIITEVTFLVSGDVLLFLFSSFLPISPYFLVNWL